MRSIPKSSVLAIVGLLATTVVAQAHVGIGPTHGFVNGFAHPLSGMDHILAMVAVGIFAAHLGGRALWLVPAAFIVMMVVGGVIGMAGIGLPFVEIAIGLSVVSLGLIVALQVNMATWLAMAGVGFFALFHGHSHGTEMPQTVSGLEYGFGFVIATGALHALGTGIGLGVTRAGQSFGQRVLQVTGSVMAATGVAILTGFV